MVIVVVALVVLGPQQLPGLARQIGRGVREFRQVQEHLRSELRDVISEFDLAPPPLPHTADNTPKTGLSGEPLP